MFTVSASADLKFDWSPWNTRHFITADADFGNGPEGVGRSAAIPLMLTLRGNRANVQNEIGPGSDRVLRGSHALRSIQTRLSLRERACLRGAKADIKTLREPAAATLGCNLLLNQARNRGGRRTDGGLRALVGCTHQRRRVCVSGHQLQTDLLNCRRSRSVSRTAFVARSRCPPPHIPGVHTPGFMMSPPSRLERFEPGTNSRARHGQLFTARVSAFPGGSNTR
jgi:hypothetical protein